jgi:hypothetical protein
VALLTSIREGRAPLFRALVAGGWLKRANGQTVADAFVESGAGCRAELANAAVEAGIPVDVISSHGGDAIMSQGGETALTSLASSHSCDDEGARLDAAARLLALGANPNHRDDAGETAIFDIENLDLLNLLLRKGADPTAKNKQGSSAVFGSWSDEIVLRLLEAGASAKGRYFDDKNLWEQMQARPMPKVKAWLANHPAQLAAAKAK